MRWVLRLVEAGNDARSRSADLMEICCPRRSSFWPAFRERSLPVKPTNMGGFVRIADPVVGDAT